MKTPVIKVRPALTLNIALLTVMAIAVGATSIATQAAQTRSPKSNAAAVGVSHRQGTHSNGTAHGYYRRGYYPYYRYDSGWYRPYGWYGPAGWGGFYSGLSLGLMVPFLPFGYSTIWYSGAPYYYADDVYYTGVPGRGYRVVAPPITEYIVKDEPGPAPVVAAPPDMGAAGTPTPTYAQPPQGQLYAYPKNGQNATQSTFDRIECERWGSGQTGFNPTSAGQTAGDAQRRNDYQRAVSACLEGRGYTVK